MPAKGKHRRPKSQRFTRSIAVAGTGGAALALPLMGATGAHAATPTATVAKTPEKAATAAPAAAKKAAGTKTYAVVSDYLSKIADEQNVSGGWKKLYSDNRSAVGSDPSLIHPGLKLTIGKKAASGSATRSSAKTTPSSAKTTTSAADTATATPAANTASTSNSSGYTLPVEGATVGTGYKVAGSMWSSGYHTGVDFVVPTGTTIKAIAAGTVVSALLGRRVRQPGRHPARRRPVLPVRPHVRALRLGGPDRDRGPADRPLGRDRQRHRTAPALRDPHHPELRLGRGPGRVPALARCRRRLTPSPLPPPKADHVPPGHDSLPPKADHVPSRARLPAPHGRTPCSPRQDSSQRPDPTIPGVRPLVFRERFMIGTLRSCGMPARGIDRRATVAPQ